MRSQSFQQKRFVVVWLLLIGALAPLRASDIAGRWKATLDTVVGRQEYIFEFSISGDALSGIAKSKIGETKITGKVTGNTVRLLELLKFEGRELQILYTGKIVSEDEIKFTRLINGAIEETFVARRVK
jgi:hypothetical protein